MEIKAYTSTKYKRKKYKKNTKLLTIILAFILALFISGLAIFLFHYIKNTKSTIKESTSTTIENIEINTESTSSVNNADNELNELLNNANKLALSYDYDKAIELLNSNVNLRDYEKVKLAINEYEKIKSNLIRQDINTIPHVFFHTLIVDTKKAFDNDVKSNGYNQVMTTIPEFNSMLQELYNRGFVLVGLHDMAEEIVDENGINVMKEKDIMLPEGKKPIVISQDDVCYYEYMVGDGFASRLIIGEDGRVTTEMDLDDGSSITGDYDLIPLLNKFIDEHPDFSYKGAKAIIAVTGYNGVFGYRTDASYKDSNPNFESDKEKVKKIAAALKNDGFELASHSWGHRHLGRISFSEFKNDSDKWEENVESLIGATDILLYPFGTDVSDWHPYKDSNERYMYLHNLGFRYYCTVDSSKYWVQIGKNYLRQGRRNLDGYRMWRDITEPDNPKLSDLFDANEIFDKDRPTPVGNIRS